MCIRQLRLSSARQQPAARNAAGPPRFDMGRLEQKQVQQQFVSSMQNRFAVLGAASATGDVATAPQVAEAEWKAFTQATQETAAAVLGPQPRHRHKEQLPQPLLATIQRKHDAYAAWLQKERRWYQPANTQFAHSSSSIQKL